MASFTSAMVVFVWGIVLPRDVVLYSFVVDHRHAPSVPTSKQTGFLFDPSSDGCTPLQPPPSTGSWFVILDDYSRCPLDKVRYAKEAGYGMMFTYHTQNRTITNEVRTAGYPIIVTLPNFASDLRRHGAVTSHGDIYVTVTTEADIYGEQDLRVAVLQDISDPTNNNGPVGPNDNGTSFNIPSIIINIFCLCAIIILAVIV